MEQQEPQVWLAARLIETEMTFSDVYKLACTQDPTIAVAAAAAEVGLPRTFLKMARVRAATKAVANWLPFGRAAKESVSWTPFRRQVSRRGLRSQMTSMGEQAKPRAVSGASPAAAAQPGLGSRIAKNWWTLPVAGAGLYGLGSFAKDMGSMAGGEQAAGYGQPSQMMPGAERYQQMMNMAHGHGY